MHRNIRFIASMAVAARRYQGKDEPTIRREALAVASKAVERNVADMIEQESIIAALAKEIDRRIIETR
jgi:hypothetical protein